MSLLPDAEREISDADKERALQAEEDAAKESTKSNDNDQSTEVNLIDNDDDASECLRKTFDWKFRFRLTQFSTYRQRWQ